MRYPVKDKTENADEQMKPTCSICGKSFSCDKNLKRHISTVHEKIKPFKCEVDSCLTTFVDKNGQKKHIENVHERVKTVKTKLCENNVDQLMVHNSSVQDENHEVPYKKARINEEKGLIIKIEKNDCINDKTNPINSDSRNLFHEKEETSEENEKRHCDIVDQDIDIKTQSQNMTPIGHCPKEREGPSFRLNTI